MRSIATSALLSLLSLGCAATTTTSAKSVSSVHTVSAPIKVSEAPIATKVALRGQGFAMVVKQDGRLLLVLDSDPEASLSGLEPILMSHRENEVVLKKPIEGDAPSLKGWVGQQVSLFGEGRLRCEASVKDVYLQGNIFIDSEDYPFGQDIAEEPMSDATFAKSAWESGRVLVVAELKNTERCEGATFGRLSTARGGVLTTSEEAPSALRELAMEELRALPQYKELQAEYEGYEYPSYESAFERSALWEDYGGEPRVSLFHASNNQTLLSVSVDSWGGCGDFNGNLFALFEVQGQSLRLISTSTQGVSPQEIFDLESDGVFEILQGEQLFKLQSGEYQLAASLYIPWDMPICGC